MQCLPENSSRKYCMYGSSADPNTNEYTDPWSYAWLLSREARRESARIYIPAKPMNIKYAMKKTTKTLQWCRMSIMASQLTGDITVCSKVCSGWQ